MPAISIIIPAYNCGAFIERCLRSCLEQTIEDIEVLVIDDASVDDTVDKIEQFKDNRLVLKRMPRNSGQSAARNLALGDACGEYVGFVDADDYIDANYYKNLCNRTEDLGADIAMAETRVVRGGAATLLQNSIEQKSTFSDKFFLLHNGSPCDKLFRTSLIKNNSLHFHDGRIWEDNLFVVQALYYSKLMVTTQGSCYNYVINENSSTKTGTLKRQEDSLFIAGELFKFALEKDFSSDERTQLSDFILKNMAPAPIACGLEYYRELEEIVGKNKKLSRKRRKYIIKKLTGFFWKGRALPHPYAVFGAMLGII